MAERFEIGRPRPRGPIQFEGKLFEKPRSWPRVLTPDEMKSENDRLMRMQGRRPKP